MSSNLIILNIATFPYKSQLFDDNNVFQFLWYTKNALKISGTFSKLLYKIKSIKCIQKSQGVKFSLKKESKRVIHIFTLNLFIY